MSVHAERQGVKQESDLREAWDLSGYPGSVSRRYRKVGEMEKVRGKGWGHGIGTKNLREKETGGLVVIVTTAGED